MAGDSHREVACVAAAFRPASSLCSGEFRARWVQVRTGTLAIFPSPQGHDIADSGPRLSRPDPESVRQARSGRIRQCSWGRCLAQKGCRMPRTTPARFSARFPNRRQPSDPHLLQRRPRPRIQTLPILLSSVLGSASFAGAHHAVPSLQSQVTGRRFQPPGPAPQL
jgi:hypothetical protein